MSQRLGREYTVEVGSVPPRTCKSTYNESGPLLETAGPRSPRHGTPTMMQQCMNGRDTEPVERSSKVQLHHRTAGRRLGRKTSLFKIALLQHAFLDPPGKVRGAELVYEAAHIVVFHQGYRATSPTGSGQTRTNGTGFPAISDQLLQFRTATLIQLRAALVRAVHELTQRQELLLGRASFLLANLLKVVDASRLRIHVTSPIPELVPAFSSREFHHVLGRALISQNGLQRTASGHLDFFFGVASIVEESLHHIHQRLSPNSILIMGTLAEISFNLLKRLDPDGIFLGPSCKDGHDDCSQPTFDGTHVVPSCCRFCFVGLGKGVRNHERGSWRQDHIAGSHGIELDEFGHSHLSHDRDCLVHPARHGAHIPLALASEICHHGFGHGHSSGSQNSQCTCANKCAAAGNTSTCGYFPVHEELHSFGRRSSFSQHIVDPFVGGQEVIGPCVMRDIHRLCWIHTEGGLWVPLAGVSHDQLVSIHRHGHKRVVFDGHGQHAISFVIDVFSDEVHTSW
mmetsp:Transcript_6784/g.41416  ORF Transcript_6784/g.41416 Transcript_6784/m.41416 type:complete len:511 (-) Transcript_6784:206-1738(-)